MLLSKLIEEIQETPSMEETATQLTKAIKKSGFKAFFVGGFIRDRLIGIKSKDIDITTEAIPEEIAEIIKKEFPDATILEVGQKFAITIAIINGYQIEIATFRKEGEYKDGRRPDSVEYTKDPKLDAARRDFTINAIYFDPETGESEDHFGGQEDIKNKNIRAVGDANLRFEEDVLRVLRAVRLAFKTGFKIEDKTYEALKKAVPKIHLISKERVREEMDKILMTDKPGDALLMLQDTGLLQELFPEVANLSGLKHNPVHHPEGVVLEKHVVNALNVCKKDLVLRWAILLHDTGKGVVKKEKEGADYFIYGGHEKESVKLAQSVLKRFKFSTDVANDILWLIEHHGDFMQIKDYLEGKKNKNFGIYQIRELLKHPLFDKLLDHCRADRGASMSAEFNSDVEQTIATLKSMEKSFKESPKYQDMTSSKNLIDGNVLASFGIKGPEIGEVLTLLKNKYFGDEIETKEELMTYFLEKVLPDHMKISRKDLEEAYPDIDKPKLGELKRAALLAIQSKALKNTKTDILEFIKNIIK